LYQVVPSVDGFSDITHERRVKANELLTSIRDSGRCLLTEYESKKLLELYNLPTTPIIVAETEEESVQAAEKLGYPVVVKINSKTITHKADVGGVRLNLKNAEQVRDAFLSMQKSIKKEDFEGVSIQPMIKMKDSYELILGANADSQCGPVLLFGSGGSLVEVYNDTTLALPPLTALHARRMIESTKISKALKGYRNIPPVDMKSLEQIMVRFSHLVMDMSHIIKEIEMNPLVVSEKQLIALDARVVLYAKDSVNVPIPAIRPYPSEYISEAKLKDNTIVVIRPCQLEDHSKLLKFLAEFSSEVDQTSATIVNAISYILKNTTKKQALPSDMLGEACKEIINILTRLCMGDYDNELAFVAEVKDKGDILGLGLISKSWYKKTRAWVAILVSEKTQGKGVGGMLLEKAINVGKKESISILQARLQEVKDNEGAMRLFKKFGFEPSKETDEELLIRKL
jgi:acetyltransferase